MQNAHVTASYVHVQRTLDLIRVSKFRLTPTDHIGRGAYFSDLTESVINHLAASQAPTLGQMLTQKTLEVGALFSHTGTFFCRGVSQHLQGKRRALPDAYAKLDDFSPGLRLMATINPDHLTSRSAADHVSGQRRLFFVGIIMAVSEHAIEAMPVIIGLLVPGLFDEGVDLGFPASHSIGEIYLSQLDAFAEAASAPPPTLAELEKLRFVAEKEVKGAFAEIIGEPFVPKDRADEMSDLTTTSLVVEGKRVSSGICV